MFPLHRNSALNSYHCLVAIGYSLSAGRIAACAFTIIVLEREELVGGDTEILSEHSIFSGFAPVWCLYHAFSLVPCSPAPCPDFSSWVSCSSLALASSLGWC